MLPRVSPDVPQPAPLHPWVAAAARGELPDWAVAGPTRREHMARVAALLDAWAAALDLSEDGRARWRAAGYLHDALRDERPEVLRPLVPPRLRDLPSSVLHGPAASERLREAGVHDEELREAIASHTIGGVRLGTLGRALYIADYLEPGRAYATEWHARLRDRMPGELHDVLREVVADRMRRGRESGRTLAPETLALWNELESEAP